jgi:2-dehydropantoate 2-reductase
LNQSTQTPLRILIYGAGAVGQAVGCLLAAGGNTVDLVLRERFISPLREGGLSVTGIFGEFNAPAGTFGVSDTLVTVGGKSYDYIIITTKSYDTASAIEAIDLVCDRTTMVVSLQNGCGNFEQVIERFGVNRALAGRVITGFEITRPGLVKITVTADDVHIGGSTEGETHPAAKQLAEAINRSGLPCIATSTIRRDLYAKLLYNCALNPLGAILGVSYGELGKQQDTRSVMNAVIDEVFRVIEGMGASTHWNSAKAYRSFFNDKQLPATAHHRASMLQDIEQGKRTEIDALTGYVSREGQRFGIPTPVCDTLSAVIRFMESDKHSPR